MDWKGPLSYFHRRNKLALTATKEHESRVVAVHALHTSPEPLRHKAFTEFTANNYSYASACQRSPSARVQTGMPASALMPGREGAEASLLLRDSESSLTLAHRAKDTREILQHHNVNHRCPISTTSLYLAALNTALLAEHQAASTAISSRPPICRLHRTAGPRMCSRQVSPFVRRPGSQRQLLSSAI